jgi:hypothetical protein
MSTIQHEIAAAVAARRHAQTLGGERRNVLLEGVPARATVPGADARPLEAARERTATQVRPERWGDGGLD